MKFLQALVKRGSHLDELRRIFPLHSKPLLLQPESPRLGSCFLIFVFAFIPVVILNGAQRCNFLFVGVLVYRGESSSRSKLPVRAARERPNYPGRKEKGKEGMRGRLLTVNMRALVTILI